MANRTTLKSEEYSFNKETGEVITTVKTYSIRTDTESFFMTFITAMSRLYRIESLTDIKVLAFLCENSEYNTGKVNLTSVKRKELMQKTGLRTKQAITNSLGRLRKLGIIAGERGDYQINPEIFWRGSTSEREKLLNANGGEIRLLFTAKEDA